MKQTNTLQINTYSIIFATIRTIYFVCLLLSYELLTICCKVDYFILFIVAMQFLLFFITPTTLIYYNLLNGNSFKSLLI